MRTSTAFFAGAGTIIMVVAGGLGGGLMIANTMNPKAPAAQMSKLERRASEASPSPSPSPGAVQAAMTPAVKDVPPQAAQDGAKAQSSDAPAAHAPATKPAATEPSPAPSSQATQREAHDKPATPDAAFAKARDADLKTPGADTKRNAQKRQTRHQFEWVERRRMPRQPEADPRDVEQAARDDGDVRSYRDDNVARNYRFDNGARSSSDDSAARGYRAENRARVYPDDSNARRYQDGSGRDYAAQPVEMELPRVRLFDGF